MGLKSQLLVFVAEMAPRKVQQRAHKTAVVEVQVPNVAHEDEGKYRIGGSCSMKRND